MKREEKAAVVDELATSLQEADAIFAVDYRGISVPQAAELRSKLRESDATFKVVKNRLAKLAAEKAGTSGLDDLFSGPVALTLIKGDAVTAAKTISTFTREHEILAYRGGIMDGEALDADSFVAISRLPGREQLYGQLVGLTASPLTGLAAGLSNLISGLGRQLALIAEQGLVGGDAPSAGSDPEPEETAEVAGDEGSDPSSDAPAEDVEASADEGSDPSAAADEEPETEEETEEE